VEFEQTPSPVTLTRPLVAADPHIDPHRLVGICCEHAGAEPLAVSLLIPVDDEALPWSESTARAERLLNAADLLLGAAGIEIEEVVVTDGRGEELGELIRLGGFDALLICAGADTASSNVLPVAARLARQHGLEVVENGGRADHPEGKFRASRVAKAVMAVFSTPQGGAR
jgi:nucleotide-binding universal stress UspA family protein